MSVDPKEPERGIFTDSFQIPSSCACSSRSEFNSTASDDITTSTTRPSASFFGTGKTLSDVLIYLSINPKYSIPLLGRFTLIIHQPPTEKFQKFNIIFHDSSKKTCV